jgi:hypothetical protein
MGKRYVYGHPDGMGLAEHHASADPEQDVEEFQARPGRWQENTHFELDMKPDTEVELVERDQERNLAILSWTDEFGNNRMTSVTDEVLHQYFEEL